MQSTYASVLTISVCFGNSLNDYVKLTGQATPFRQRRKQPRAGRIKRIGFGDDGSLQVSVQGKLTKSVEATVTFVRSQGSLVKYVVYLFAEYIFEWVTTETTSISHNGPDLSIKLS